MTWKAWEDAANHGPGRIGRKVGLWLLVTFIVVSGIVCVMNPFRQAARIAGKTMDAGNVIYNYEWFHQRYQDIEAIDAKVSGARVVLASFTEAVGPRSSWKRDDRIEWSRLNSIWLGLTQQRNDLAAQYNARTGMANRAIFKSGDLPHSIPIEGDSNEG